LRKEIKELDISKQLLDMGQDSDNFKKMKKELIELDIQLDYCRESVLTEVIFVFFVQAVFCVALVYTAEFPEQDEPPTLAVAYSRIMAGLLMQIWCISELTSGLDKMKFCINHRYKFERPVLAFSSGLAQALIMMALILINYYVIMAAESVMDVIMNFLALMVISEIDDQFYEMLGGNDISSEILENENDVYDELIKIEVTSSNRALPTEEFTDINKFEPSE